MTNEKRELRALFHGRVQGVGFRWALQALAQERHLAGWARNLPNGTVELLLQGSDEQLQDFLLCIKTESGFAKIEKIEKKLGPILEKRSGFEIVF